MDVDLVIRYRHSMDAEGTHLCTGEMFYRSQDESFPPFHQREFQNESFNKLLAEAHNRMNKDAEVSIQRIIIERTDRQGLQPIVMDEPTKELLRSDPALAFKLLNYDRPAMYGSKKGHVAPPALRSGYDSLSEALGEEVYVRQHRNLVECPGCGMWSQASQPFICKKKCQVRLPVNYTEQWARFKVTDLLALKLHRYYLPRGFNKNKPWITAVDLQALYEAWKKIEEQNKETKSC